MNEFVVQELEKIISDGNFDSLIGKIENDFFDCKCQPYDLNNNYSKQELAKDVSSFANSNGGYILIGPQTPQTEKEKSKTHYGDEVIKISLLDQELVNPRQYLGVIKAWIYPDDIPGINVYWKASRDDNKKGIVIIEIPAQKESLKPFLISKVVEEKNKISEKIFGYAERKGDSSNPKKIAGIHRIMQDGLFYDKNIKDRFDSLEALVEEREKKEQNNHNIIDKKVNKILQSYDKE